MRDHAFVREAEDTVFSVSVTVRYRPAFRASGGNRPGIPSPIDSYTRQHHCNYARLYRWLFEGDGA
jgi:hypothetical protein